VFWFLDYLRLVHLASKKIHARSVGRRDVLTRQPKDGRRSNGGLRFGDMEVSAAAAHGAAVNLQHRLREFSDAFVFHVCKQCKRIVDEANPTISFYFCNGCSTADFIRTVQLPFTFRVLQLELQATGVDLILDIMDDTVVSINGRIPSNEARRPAGSELPG
jgi:DNA-directed RNA polymerase beta subunit